MNYWRRIYRAFNTKVTPHITICYPFVPIDVWEENRTRVLNAVRSIHPFTITLRELGTFVQDESILWLKPEDGRHLNKIYMKMQEIFSKYMKSPSLAYVPHLTIGLFLTVEELVKARSSVQKQLKPVRFTVDKLLFAIFEQEGWRIHDHISLQ